MGAGELPKKSGLLLLRTVGPGVEAAGCCRELAAGGPLYIWVIYSLVCCWLELQAGPGASSPQAPASASSLLSLAWGACMGG